MRAIYENHRVTLIRIVVLGGVAAGLAGLYFAWVLLQTYGLAPGDGGVLRPLSERLTFAGVIAALSIATAFGLALYASLYVTEIRCDSKGQHYSVTTLSLFGHRVHEFQLSDFAGSDYFQGQLQTVKGHRVDAPWVTLRVAGRWLPFILDVQADADAKAIGRIAPGASDVFGHHSH